MHPLRQFIEGYTELSDEDWNAIAQSFSRKEFSSNEMILNEGQVCKYFYFLQEGLVRFFINREGDDITKYFTFAPYCFTSIGSFRTGKPALESIQALEQSVVWFLPVEDADKLLLLNGWANFSRLFIQEVQQHTEALLMEAKTSTAQERYTHLMAKHPDLIQRIPLKHLSTFMGIAPQSLSRIRKNYIHTLRT